MDKQPVIASDYLQSVVRLLRRTLRFWWLALVVLVLGVVTTVAVGRVRPKLYRSEAVVYYQEGLQWTANEGMTTRRIGQRLKDMILARAQLAKLIEDLNLYSRLVKAGRIADAVEEMRLATAFKVNEGDTFVITYTGDSPDEAQRVTSRLTDVLIGENTRLRSEQAEVARAFLDAEKKRNEADLNAKEAEHLRFLAKHPEFAHDQSTIVALRKKGADAPGKDDNNALAALRREEDRLRKQIANPGAIPRGPQDPALLAAKNEAEAKLKAAQRDLADRRSRFTEQHPDVRSAAALVNEAEDAYKRAVDALAAADAKTQPDVEIEPRAVLEARLAQVQQEIVAYQRKHPREQTAPEEPVASNDAAQRIVALETEWARLNREVAEARERFQQLDTRQFMASMTATTLMSGQAAQIVVIDPAYTPSHPVGMSPTRFFVVGVLATLALAIGVAMLFALLDDRVYDHADVERLELAPVLIEVTRRSLRGRGRVAS
jgi:uncharacterized protein involved in exopolysaccharide biosynthesis